MTHAYRNLKPVVTAIALVWGFCLAASAQTADSTDAAALLRDLAQAAPEQSARVERQLQALWSRSGSASMDLLLKRGREAMERGAANEAIEHLTALTDHAPDFAEGWHVRASAYYAAGLYGPALADIGQALALNPDHYSALFGLASILEALGDETRAFAAYERVVAIHPHHAEANKALDRLKPAVKGREL